MELPAAKNLHQQFFTEGQQQEENAPQKVLGHHQKVARNRESERGPTFGTGKE